MNLLLRADINSPCGASSMARAFVKGIHKHVTLKIENRSKMAANIGMDVTLATLLQDLCAVDMPNPDVVLHMDTPETWTPKVDGAKHIGWMRWNTTAIHSEWVRVINSMDEVWVTTSSAAQVFKNCGVTVPIVLVPAPVDEIFGSTIGEHPLVDITYTERGDPIRKEDRRVVIGIVAHWNSSKCIDDFLVAAITQLDPTKYAIVLKTWLDSPVQTEDLKIRDKVQHIRNHVKMIGPPVTVVNQIMTDEQVAQLYNSFDIYMSLGRCDGTSISALQAMACGVHVVSSDWGKPDYLNNPGATSIAAHGVPSCGMGDAYLPNAYWGQFDFQDFKYKMQNVEQLLENKEALEASQGEVKQFMHDNCSQEAAKAAVLSRLGGLLAPEAVAKEPQPSES